MNEMKDTPFDNGIDDRSTGGRLARIRAKHHANAADGSQSRRRRAPPPHQPQRPSLHHRTGSPLDDANCNHIVNAGPGSVLPETPLPEATISRGQPAMIEVKRPRMRRITTASPPAQIVPAMIARAGEPAVQRFRQFFTPPPHRRGRRRIRAAHYQAARSFFTWLDRRGVTELAAIKPLDLVTYLDALHATAADALGTLQAKTIVCLHRTAIRLLFDWLAHCRIVNGITRGETLLLPAEQLRLLLDRIDPSTAAGLRDRALIGLLAYASADLPAILRMQVGDCYLKSGFRWLRLESQDGVRHVMLAHQPLGAIMDDYLALSRMGGDYTIPLFRTARGRTGTLADKPIDKAQACAIIRRRIAEAGIITSHGLKELLAPDFDASRAATHNKHSQAGGPP
jgi:integrase/recombinase XerC